MFSKIIDKKSCREFYECLKLNKFIYNDPYFELLGSSLVRLKIDKGVLKADNLYVVEIMDNFDKGMIFIWNHRKFINKEIIYNV